MKFQDCIVLLSYLITTPALVDPFDIEHFALKPKLAKQKQNQANKNTK